MKHQGNFTRVKFEDKIYWRRGDGCWFFFGTSLLSLVFQEVRHSTYRKLEDAWVKNGLHFDSDAEIWRQKYEQLRAELEWEKEARQQQANLTEHRDLKKPKVVAGIDLGSKEGSYPAFVHMSNPTENNWVKDAFNEKAKEIGRKSVKFQEDLYYSLLPPHLMYDRGAPEGEVFEQAEGFLMTGNPQMIFAPSTRPVGQGSFQLVFDGKLQGEGFIGWKDNVYVCEFFPVEEPTRPSEDDMMSKSHHGDGIMPDSSLLQSPTHDQHPQFRDIGVRIDRYGKMVFKPELVKGGEQ